MELLIVRSRIKIWNMNRDVLIEMFRGIHQFLPENIEKYFQ
jgi:hypothetical protein